VGTWRRRVSNYHLDGRHRIPNGESWNLMRRILTLFTGSKLATAAAATALSVVTTATLVAGGIVVSRVVDAVGGEPLAALPAVGPAQGPIVVGRTERVQGRPVRVLASDPSAPAAATGLAAAAKAPIRTVALLDEADRVSGGVSAALDAEEPNRMEEISTIERIESLIKDDSDEEVDTTSEEGESPDEDQAEPPDDTEDPNKLNEDGPLQTVQEVTESTTEAIYSGTAAGSASPSV
jgi:hypothetical protein